MRQESAARFRCKTTSDDDFGESDFIWKRWVDSAEWAVYHRPSRQTFLLDELSATVLRLLETGARSAEEIAESLIGDFCLEADDRAAAVAYAERVVARLGSLGVLREPSQ